MQYDAKIQHLRVFVCNEENSFQNVSSPIQVHRQAPDSREGRR
jgi:hypothetical protein